jgi:hypothetical protein
MCAFSERKPDTGVVRRFPQNFSQNPSMSTIERQVMLAADVLIDAFGRHDRADYFAAFAPPASFVFHHVARELLSRDAYQRLWRTWEQEDGFALQVA